MTKISVRCPLHPRGCPWGRVCDHSRENINPMYPLYERVEVENLIISQNTTTISGTIDK